jgi:hypothetical protein
MSATVLPKNDNLTHVETDLTVCEISVDTETRSETEREIGKETHCESSDKSDTRGSDDVISSQFLLAKVVVDVCDTDWVVWGTCTDTWSSSVGEDGSVDTDNLSCQPTLYAIWCRYSRKAWQLP